MAWAASASRGLEGEEAEPWYLEALDERAGWLLPAVAGTQEVGAGCGDGCKFVSYSRGIPGNTA